MTKALLGLIFALLLWGLGSYGLYEPHEGHFAGVAFEMVTRGDWITPHLNGAPYLNKPPLLYWMIASCDVALGFNEWSARLPLALIGFGGVALVWHWARRLWGVRAGRCAAVMLSVTAGWFLFSHQLLIDLLLSTLYLLDLYLLWRAVLQPASRSRWAAFYATAGIMVMAKGLVGLLFPLAALAVFALWRRDGRFVGRCYPLMGLCIVLAICGPWVALLEYRNPGALHYMLVNEHFKRIVDMRLPKDYSVVKVSVWGYLLVAAVWLMPWGLLAWQVARFCRKGAAGSATSLLACGRLTPGAPPPTTSPGGEGDRGMADAVLLLAIGALLPIVIFLPMPSRLIYYSLPAIGPFAVLAAGWWSGADSVEAATGRIQAAMSFMLCGAAILSAAFWAPGLLRRAPQLIGAHEMPHLVAVLALLLGSALLLGGFFLAVRKTVLALAVLFALLGAAEIQSVRGFRLCSKVLSSKRLVEHLRAKAGPDCVWISEGSRELGASASLSYYLGQDAQGNARTVRVMKDSPLRPPPQFPGPEPSFYLDAQGLNTLWRGGRPALFVTDVYRTDWKTDPPSLPEPEGERHEIPLPWLGLRKVYANNEAWKRVAGRSALGFGH
jgi:4-amino-4-deoxy-L-arabinose transferase-like glycosyltransferase